MNVKNQRKHDNHSFNKNKKEKEERIASALYGLRRLKMIKSYKSNLHFDGGEFIKADLIIYPNWKGKILLNTENGCNCQKPKKTDEYGVYYLEITSEMNRACIKTAIMEILLKEMEKREKKNNIALK